MAADIKTQRPPALQHFDAHMYQAALAFYGLPQRYNRVFKSEQKRDKETNELLFKPDGSPDAWLKSCNAQAESSRGNAIWVQINQPRDGSALNKAQYPKKARNEDIGTLQNITLDSEYPPEPQKALAIGKKLVDYLIAEGLAHEDQPTENSGAGFHIVLPVPAIEIADGDSAKRWNDAVAMLVHERIKPEFLRLCEQAEIVMDLEGFDISRVLSAPGTWRPRHPTKKDCSMLQQGFLRRWMAPYTNGRYPVRVENHKLKALLQECYERCASTPKSEHQAQPSEHESSYAWLYRNAGQYYRDNRSAHFQALVGAVYQKFGEQAVLDLAQDIDRLSRGKYGDRAYEEAKRSLDKAQDMPRDITLPSPVKKRQARVNKESDLDEGGDETKKPTALELLTVIAERAKFIVTPSGDLFAHVPVNSHHETVSISEKGSGFRRWLIYCFDKENGYVPNSEALTQIMERVKARAAYEGEQTSVYTRIAEKNGHVYLDMGNDKWECIEIAPDGWRVITCPPVYFRRPNGLLPLPAPTRGGSLNDLRKIINVKTDKDFTLIVGWLLGTLHPTGPYAVLGLNGERGSGKSKAEIYLRSIIDPNVAPARNAPRDEREAAITAQNNMVIALDNLSSMPLWLSDVLCRIATGNGFSTRQMYEDDVEKIFNAKRPIILNGIEDGIISQGDLLSRTILVTLEPPTKYLAEEDIEQRFQGLHPALLGSLLNAASLALRDRRKTRLENAPRMVDFAQWVTAAEPALKWAPGTFMTAFAENQENATSIITESSPVAKAIVQFMALDSQKHGWMGLTSELHEELKKFEVYEKAKRAPKDATRLSGQIKRIASSLRAQGIDLQQPERTKRGSFVTIRHISPEKISPSGVAGVAGCSYGVAKNSLATPVSTPDIEPNQAEKSQIDVAGVASHAPLSALLSSNSVKKNEEERAKIEEPDRECKIATPAPPATPAEVLLSEMASQGCTLRICADGKWGIGVPDEWTDEQFQALNARVDALDSELRKVFTRKG